MAMQAGSRLCGKANPSLNQHHAVDRHDAGAAHHADRNAAATSAMR